MVSKIDKIISMLLERDGLNEELNSLLKPIYLSNDDGLVRYLDGEIIDREEFQARKIKGLKILTNALEEARKTTLIEGKITLTEEE